jgi:hypothetical protein
LGAYLTRTLSENGISPNVSYEVKLERCGLRVDIMINGTIEIESKAQGIFDLDALRIRWDRLNRERPDLMHILVGWRHYPSMVIRIKEFIPESNHFCFYNLSRHQNEPRELERLVRSVIRCMERTNNAPA